MSSNRPDFKSPNILLILTDQQRYDTIAGLGFEHATTPNLDRLVGEGAAFTNCFITAPSCCPSRASLFNGTYPHTTGVYKNGDTWTTSWVSALNETGYHCVNVGKMHTVPLTTPLGFHERYVVENKDRYLEGRYFFDEWDKALRARGLVKQQRELYRQRDDYHQRLGAFTWDLDEDMQSDNFVGGMARWWIDTYPIDEPFFMEVGFPGPHPPYDPTPRWLDHYRDVDIPVEPVTEEDLAGQPSAMKALRQHMTEVDHDSVAHVVDASMEQRRFQRACYLANVSMIDEQIGIILEGLESKGLLENTVVIFSSDHGDCLGDHGHSQKWSMYEQVVHVPAILWAGRQARETLGILKMPKTVDGLVSLMDFGPTILDLAAAPQPGAMEAVSLLPLLKGGTLTDQRGSTVWDAGKAVAKSDAVWDLDSAAGPLFVSDTGRDYVFAEHGRDNILDSVDVMTMVRSDTWKMVVYAGSDEGQLYNLVDDPGEHQNLWNVDDCTEVRQHLTQVIAEWLQESSYRTRVSRRR